MSLASSICCPLQIKAQCDPCGRCTRIAWPYVGWPGIIAYVMEFILLIVLNLALLGIFDLGDRAIFIILLVTTTIYVALWIWNLFWRAPCYITVLSERTCDSRCGLELIGKGCPGDYATRVRDDIQQVRDETHLREGVYAGLTFLILFAIYVGVYGGEVFDTPTGEDALAFLLFIGGRILLALWTGVVWFATKNILAAEPDLWYRHFTAVDNDQYLLGCVGVVAANTCPINIGAKNLGRKNAKIVDASAF